MKIKTSLIAFLITFILIFFNSGYLFAQEAGDREDSTLEGVGVSIIPNDDELASLLTGIANPGAVVSPLIQTKWGQGAPYRNMLPVGHRSFCNLVASAQIMKYHNYPVSGTGQSEAYTMRNGAVVPLLNFNIAYDWDNMLNSYRSDGRDSNERQRNAVATLIYHIGVARGRDFISGNSRNSFPAAFANYFGYDRSIQLLHLLYHNDDEWKSIIIEQLDAGLPVYYYGHNQTNTSNHGFILDGYDNEGRFHVNWGWNGTHDGWYFLHQLTPGNHNFSYQQTVAINIKPDEGGTPKPWEMALRNFNTGRTSVPQNEMFTVNVGIRNLASLDIFPGGQMGIALVDNSIQGIDSRIVEIIGIRNRAALNPLTTANSVEINCYVPETVRPGQYRMMTVIRPEGGNWSVVTRSAIGEDVPNAIDITVTPGVANGGGYGMALTAFNVSKTTVSQNELFTVTPTLRNIAVEAFPGGQLGVALVDNSIQGIDGRIVEVIGIINRNPLNSNAVSNPMVMNCHVPETVNPGRYQLRIVVRPAGGQWRIATLSNAGVPNSIDFNLTAVVDRNYTGIWQIQLGNGRYADIRTQNSNNGTAVIQQDRSGGQSQQWSFERHNDGTYTITNVQSNRVMDVQNSRITQNGALVQQWQNNNTPNQRWRIITAGEFVRFQNVASGKLLDMSRSNYNNLGHQFHQWDDNGGENQQFRLEAVRQ